MPIKAKITNVPKKTYFILRIHLFFSAPFKYFFFFKEPVISITVPSGHIQPQKNLPIISVIIIIVIDSSNPGKSTRSLKEVINIIRGSALKSISGETNPFKG